MKWSLLQLRKQRTNEIKMEDQLDLELYFKKNNSDVRQATPTRVTGYLRMKQDSNIVATLRLQGEWVLPCSRTLEDVTVPYDICSQETFTLEKSQLVDETWHIIEQETVDLMPVIKELLLLAIPMQVFSNKVSWSEYPQGNDWQVKTEEQYWADNKENERAVDPRLAGLAQFYQENEKQ